MKNSEVLIIGSGFIGTHLHKVLQTDNSVTLISRSQDFDLSNLSQTKLFFSNKTFDYIINATGKVDQSPNIFNASLRDNLIPTLNLLETLNSTRLKRLIHLGSNAEYGAAEVPHSSGTLELPSSPYGVMKLSATKAVLSMSHVLPVTVVRPFSVFGLGMSENTFLAQAIRFAKENRVFRMTDGEQTRDFIPIESLVADIREIAISDFTLGKVVNSCSGIEFSLNRVIELLTSIYPSFSVDRSIEPRVGENRRSVGVPWRALSEDHIKKAISELASK